MDHFLDLGMFFRPDCKYSWRPMKGERSKAKRRQELPQKEHSRKG
jgi:hypothetical protein